MIDPLQFKWVNFLELSEVFLIEVDDFFQIISFDIGIVQ